MSKRENGTTGLLQDFLIEAYQKKANDMAGPDEHGDLGDGDLLLRFLHAEFRETVDSDASVEEKLDHLREVVGDALRDLTAVFEAIHSEVSEPVRRAIAAEKMGHEISQAMPGDEVAPAPAFGGPSPI